MNRTGAETWGSACCGALLALALAWPAGGQSLLSLDAAIKRAARSHPLLLAAPARVSAAESNVMQSRLRPNPRLYLQSENWRAWNTPGLSPADQIDTYAYLSQPFETGGKRAQRTALAQAGLRRVQLERELLERQIAARVKHAYWSAAAAVRIHEVAKENVENFRGVIEYHENRVREGAMPEADLLKVRLEGERLQLAVNTAELEVERTRIELFRAMGETTFPPVRLADALEGDILAPPVDIERALDSRVELQITRQSKEEAAINANLQRALAKPDVDVVAGYKQTSGYPTVLGGVQASVPLLNRNQGNIAAADAAIRIADAEIAAEAALVRAEVAAAVSAVEIRRRQVSVTLPALRRQAEESARIALAAYREGGSDLLRLLDAQRVRIELDTLYYQTLAEYRQSVVALEMALGVNR